MHEKSFLIKHYWRLLGRKYLLLTPSKTDGRVPSQQGVPSTHNLQPGILGGFTGCGRLKVHFTRSVEGAERSDARNGGSTKIAENPETELLPKLLSIYWKFGSNFCRLINLSHSLSPYLTFIMKANGTHISFEKTLTRGLLFWPFAYSWEYSSETT